MSAPVKKRFQKALILEPELGRRKAVRQILIGAGIRKVLEAGTAKEAITLLNGELVDLVFTTWEAPGLCGTELLKALRNPGRNRDLPVILLDDGLARTHIVAAVKAGIAGRLPVSGGAACLGGILQAIRDGKEMDSVPG